MPTREVGKGVVERCVVMNLDEYLKILAKLYKMVVLRLRSSRK